MPTGSFGGVAVIELVSEAESICEGAFLRSADLMPSCVRSVTVSLWLGGVTAMGAIVAAVYERASVGDIDPVAK